MSNDAATEERGSHPLARRGALREEWADPGRFCVHIDCDGPSTRLMLALIISGIAAAVAYVPLKLLGDAIDVPIAGVAPYIVTVLTILGVPLMWRFAAMASPVRSIAITPDEFIIERGARRDMSVPIADVKFRLEERPGRSFSRVCVILVECGDAQVVVSVPSYSRAESTRLVDRLAHVIGKMRRDAPYR